MKIRAIDSEDRREAKRFISLPFTLYRRSREWVPPLISDMKLVLNRSRHPFYAHSSAEFFLAEEGREAVGRVAVLHNRKYNEFHGRRSAFFYFFDAVEDEEVSSALFAAAGEWAKGRGLDQIVGPLGFLSGDGIGVLVEGFEHRPALGIPYNYPYYDPLLRAAGFARKTDYYSGYLPGDHRLEERFYRIAEKVKSGRGFWIKTFSSKRELKKWIPGIQEVYNRTFTENFEYSPVTEQEARLIADRLLAVADPRLIKLVMKGETIIGFLFAFVDISAAIQKIGGRMWPLGWIALLREFKRSDWLNFNGTGLLPGHRGVGANAVLYTEMAATVQEHGFRHADIVQIEEQNAKSMGDMAAIGVQWYKRHRVYEKVVG